jgi:hypothetical protein
MSKQIVTYNDLLEEQQRMETLFRAQKELVQMDLKLLRGEFRPALRAVKTVGKMFTREKDKSILGLGSERLIDFVFQRFILNKAGWLARFIVPVLVKNVSSHEMAENKQGWMQKLRSWLGKRNHNGQTPPDPDPASTGTAAKNN